MVPDEMKPKMTWPNRLTLIRIILVPVFAIVLLEYTPEKDWLRYIALAIFACASATDAIDGIIARVWNQTTKFGMLLDPLADKMLINVAYILLATQHELPLVIPKWIPVVILGRDVIIVMGAWFLNEVQGLINVRPRFVGKVTAFLQAVSVMAVLLDLGISKWLLLITVGFTVISLSDYIWFGSKKVAESGTA